MGNKSPKGREKKKKKADKKIVIQKIVTPAPVPIKIEKKPKY